MIAQPPNATVANQTLPRSIVKQRHTQLSQTLSTLPSRSLRPGPANTALAPEGPELLPLSTATSALSCLVSCAELSSAACSCTIAFIRSEFEMEFSAFLCLRASSSPRFSLSSAARSGVPKQRAVSGSSPPAFEYLVRKPNQQGYVTNKKHLFLNR